MIDRKCDICGSSHKVCHNAKIDKLLCDRHARQVYKYGKVVRSHSDSNKVIYRETYADIELYDKDYNIVGYTKVDLEDIEKSIAYRWSSHHVESKNCSYVRSRVNGRVIFLHRLIMNIAFEIFTFDTSVDHINGDGYDNRKQNLRICNNSQNTINRRLLKSNTSGYTGVSWDTEKQKWSADISPNRKHIFLGYFSNIEDAIKARKEAENTYFGEYAYKGDTLCQNNKRK